MENIELKLIKVSDRLYYLPHYKENDWCTIGLVVGDNHTLMLDAGSSKRHVDIFMQKLEENGLPKPDLCILTHNHWDHTYGLGHMKNVTSFATKGTTYLFIFIRHQATPYLLVITLSIRPYSAASAADIKLSLSVSRIISSRGLPVFSAKILLRFALVFSI